jgi:hypothetical protein
MDITAVGRQFGLTEAQTRTAIGALAPVVAAGVRRAAQTPEGLQQIFKSALTDNYGRTLEDEREISFGRAKPTGDNILAQIFGNQNVSREVAQRLSTSSGIDQSLLKKLLPIVAMMIMGQLSKKVGSVGAAGGLNEIVGNLESESAQAGSGGLGGILKKVFGGAPRHDPGVSQGVPNPLEDMLGNILRGGPGEGRTNVKQVPPEQMGEILKGIFSGSTGEQPYRLGRKTLDDLLGGGTNTGSAAENLLNSVEKAVSQR